MRMIWIVHGELPTRVWATYTFQSPVAGLPHEYLRWFKNANSNARGWE